MAEQCLTFPGFRAHPKKTFNISPVSSRSTKKCLTFPQFRAHPPKNMLKTGEMLTFFLVDVLETGEMLKVFLGCPRNPGNVKHFWGQFRKVLKTREMLNMLNMLRVSRKYGAYTPHSRETFNMFNMFNISRVLSIFCPLWPNNV